MKVISSQSYFIRALLVPLYYYFTTLCFSLLTCRIVHLIRTCLLLGTDAVHTTFLVIEH